MNEKYIGVKFQVEFLEKQIPEHALLPELIKWCEIFHKTRLAPVNGEFSNGNLSFRCEAGKDEFIITGTQVALNSKLTGGHFVKVLRCDMQNNKAFVSGLRNPSSETMLHYAIYKARPEVNAVFHGHSAEILAKTKSYGFIETKTEEPYGSLSLVQSVIEVLSNHNFLIMKNHGFVAIEKSMNISGELSLKYLDK